MDELKPCPFCGGTKIWIGTIAECEMQDKKHPDYEFNSNTMLLFVIIRKADVVHPLVEAQERKKKP